MAVAKGKLKKITQQFPQTRNIKRALRKTRQAQQLVLDGFNAPDEVSYEVKGLVTEAIQIIRNSGIFRRVNNQGRF